ncbi:MAG: hypothetical protein Q8L37_06910 [Candidatus Gottesmanbacteria bacterium]|nr:hypothetical protein [Candidatus Gottesmanbacteria bacterium]
MKAISTYKINEFLKTHTNIMEDYEVVYLMVEIRKLLDEVRDLETKRFPLLRFYADWIVHTEKSRITDEIRLYMQKVDKTIPLKPFMAGFAEYDIDFLEFDELRSEMENFFKRIGVKTVLCEQLHWANFLSALAYALVNQPILNPIPNIVKFVFEPTLKGMRMLLIKFNDVRGECRYMATPNYPEEV